ncbi:hypothetical protein LshimejAT787_1801070 [Lyophyllum shimeji]|uniref:Arrestin-like N-terminal domain-containing protein n=1 Tax=Lyophyllum shimeji TaxID=47721 RepID=A0A9P3UUI2_LYOSH|nr:hypothetical protein LshimejAT787_1801070 [Lyophyllum shimeji]
MTLAHPIFVAGKFISGKMEMECRADKGLGIGIMMVELFASQELTSRDHSATSTFLHSRRLFQGPGLPPSNAVQAHPLPGDPPLPPNYHQARRGISTFLFRIPLPSSAPSSISFGNDLARVRYEARATVGVVWKGEKTLVTCKREIDVVESYEDDFSRVDPEGVVVGEFGKIWVQGKIVGGIAIAGESACVELQVKNHSNKKNTGLTLKLSRELVLPGLKPGEPSPLQLSDVLTTVPFRGPDYVIHPGAEGVASLVFDVPKHARGVRGGTLEGDESEGPTSESLFAIRCTVGITINMGIGTKDIHLDIPVPVFHPAALPEPTEYPLAPYNNPCAAPVAPSAPYIQAPYAYPALPVSPPLPAAYIDPVQNQVWLPPPQSHTPQLNGHHHVSPPIDGTQPQYYFPPPPHIQVPAHILPRPLSAGPTPNDPFQSNGPSIGMGPAPLPSSQHLLASFGDMEPEEGKGERASRVPASPTTSGRRAIPASYTPVQPARQPNEAHLRNLPPASLAIAAPARNDCSLAPVVHSPRPFLSPKRSFDNSVPKSERVEQLERMAEEVAKTTADLSLDLPKAAEPRDLKQEDPQTNNVLAESNINKTLPIPPAPTKKVKENGDATQDRRTRIDEYFAESSASAVPESKAPPTPLAAVTPVKLPSKPKSSEYLAQLHPYPHSRGQAESGLDALERRLLAEVGTRKMDVGNERRPAWSVVGVQPINIPAKEVPPDALNDSAISSLTLAGAGEVERGREGGGDVDGDGEVAGGGALLELDGDHDSDERTHRAARSSASGGSRKTSKGERGERGRKKVKRKDKDGEGHATKSKKKTAASKGKVAAWLGTLNPEVPPMDEVPPSPDLGSKSPPFLDHSDLLPAADAEVARPRETSATRASGRGDEAKMEIRPNLFATDAAVVEEARHVADIWSSSSPAADVPAKSPPRSNDRADPVLKDVSPVLPLISPAPRTQSIRTDRRVSPPSLAGALDVLGAKHHNVGASKAPTSVPAKSSPPNKVINRVSHVCPCSPLSPIRKSNMTFDLHGWAGRQSDRYHGYLGSWRPGCEIQANRRYPTNSA